MTVALFRLLSCVALALGSAPARADSIRCDGGTVSVGDSKLDLIAKCGAPALREQRQEERGGGRAGARVGLTVERWTYDFGPRQFVEIVTLETGKVVAVDRGGYGYELAPARKAIAVPRARCEPAAFHVGDSTFDVLTRCGEPAAKEFMQEARSAALAQTVARDSWRTVQVERWWYDFGPRALVRSLEFENGLLVRIDTGSYGYSTP